jgi:hypothetical protein
MLRLVAAAGFVAAFPLFARDTRATAVTCLVPTTNGPVQGLDVGPSCSFLGIPYAAPPTAALRWKPPVTPAAWTTPLSVTGTPAPANCPNVNNGPPAGNENCLTLNVWVRNPLPSTPAPVMIWLHTGSFVASSASFVNHNARRFAEETGIIVRARPTIGADSFGVPGALGALPSRIRRYAEHPRQQRAHGPAVSRMQWAQKHTSPRLAADCLETYRAERE